jgi:alkylation response protein AidB-like acyl-CoA dehydrogenase
MGAEALLEAVQTLAPQIKERAAETEAARCLPADLAQQLADAGVFRLYVPASLGGLEVDPLTALDVVETLAAADGSTGWTSFILNTTFFTSWLEPTVAKEILSTQPGSGMAGVFSPIGRATPDGDGGGFRLDGRWPFNSGSPHASWFCEGAFVVGDDGQPRTLPGGQPDWRFLFLPAAEVEILDTWHVSGLRGTASHDVAVSGALIPEERTSNPIFRPAPHDGPIFRWPFFSALASLMAAFPLGVARRALDEFATVATTKSRGSGATLADTDAVSLAMARCEAQLRSARAFAVNALGDGWEQALAGDALSTDKRVAIRIAALHAMRSGVEVVNTVFALAGGGALYETSPLQRCWRDIHAGSHHLFFSDDHTARAGRVLLGRGGEDWMI